MEVRKPLTVAREEFLSGLVKLINESHLPAFVIVGVMKDLLEEVRSGMNQEYEADKRAYEEALASQEEPVQD